MSDTTPIHVYVGIDPASKLMGVCWFDTTGVPLEPIGIIYPYQTFSAKGQGKKTRFDRLRQLRSLVTEYLLSFPRAYAAIYQEKHGEYRPVLITAFGIEEPSDRFGSDSHSTMFVNGMSYLNAWDAVQDYLRETKQDIPIYEFTPGSTSESLGLAKSAPKRDRCGKVALLGQGRYVWEGQPDTEKSSHGWCDGGSLHGANADALDAGAAAYAARAHHRNQQLLRLGDTTDAGVQSKRGAPRRKPRST